MYIQTLIRVKNAQGAKLETVKVPFSNMDMAVLELLAKEGYIGTVEKKGRMPKRVIEIALRYSDGIGAIRGVKFISKPSRRISMHYEDLRPAFQGYGLRVISTSKGIMDSVQARKQKLGGVALFDIW